jgi:ribosome recycling factor
MTDEILLETEERMDHALEAFRRELAAVRTGRASTALIEHLGVDLYGQRMQLIQLANLAAPEAQLLTVTPYDRGSVDAIMRAIQTSELGITPQSDGRIIRLPIPPLTEQRRKEFVKQVHTKAEEGRVSVRNARRHANDELKKAVKAGEISEDDERRAMTEVDHLTQKHIDQLDAAAREKERELLEV